MTRVRWNLAVRCVVLACAVGAVAAHARAAVVIANQTKSTIAFELTVGGAKQKHALRPGELIPVPDDKPVVAHYKSGNESLTDKVEPNSLYYFLQAGPGAQLHRVSLETGERPLRRPLAGRASRPRKRAKPGDVIRVRIVVDRFHPASNQAATKLLKLRVLAASEIITRHCGVRFDVVEQGTWAGDDRGLKYDERQQLLDKELSKSNVDLLLGFETPHEVDASGRPKKDDKKPKRAVRADQYLQPEAQPFAESILIAGHDTRVTEPYRLKQVVVALAGYLCAVPSPESGSVMKLLSRSQAQRNKGPNAVAFDPLNALAIALAGEQIRRHGARSIADFDPRIAATISAIRAAAEVKFRPHNNHRHGKVQPGKVRIVTHDGKRKIPLFDAAFADGTVLRGATLDGWFEKSSRPHSIENARLQGARVLDAARPLVWMRRTDARPQPPTEGFIEMRGGDRLPGQAVEFRADKGDVPAHVVVTTDRDLTFDRRNRQRGEAASANVRVRTRWLRRIVRGKPVLEDYAPSTLVKRDGSRLAFRSVQLIGRTVRILRDGDVQSIPLDEVAELHFPEIDQWEAYYEQLAALNPECRLTLIQCDTTSGLRATALAIALQSAVRRGEHDADGYIESYLPPWSLAALWVQDTDIAVRRFFKPYEVPLSLFRPANEHRAAVLATGLGWQADRNVRGEPLASGGLDFAWGFGVQATSHLEFRLPVCATGFRSWVGLDQSVRSGGCARALVYADSTKRAPLYQSPLLVGSTHVLDTGVVRLPTQQRQAWRLFLVADAAHNDRPAGTDPWDVRDRFDWLEPRLLLDESKLKMEVERVLK